MKSIKLSLVQIVVLALLATTASAFTFDVENTKIDIGGYVKLDLTYADPGVPGSGTVFTPGSVPRSTLDSDANIDFSARESRYWLQTNTTTDVGTIKTYIEGDFYGDGGNEYVSNSYSLRLRHAYGSFNGWLMGQTWTTFMDLAHLGELIDFTQHKSVIFVRQAQIRYTHELSNGSLMFAVENPENFIKTDAGASVSNSLDNNNIPDLVARWNIKGETWQTSASALMRQFKIDDGTGNTMDEIGFAGSLTGKIIFPNKDDLRVQVNGGALGRYMGLMIYPDAIVEDNDLKVFNSYGVSGAYRHLWTPKVRSTLMLAGTFADTNSNSTLFDSSRSVHLNLLWDVAPKVTLGVEVQRVELERGNGEDYDLNRLQFSARYGF